MTINKQALTNGSARESGNILLIVAARMARRELFTPLHFVSELPQKVVSMRVFREALERSEETLQREVCKIVDGHRLMEKKLKEAEAKLEAKDSTIAAQQQEIRMLLNALERKSCPKCNDTGMADSGGTQPWGEPIEIECDCRQQDANAAELIAAGIITKVGE